jgi:hypothetical protein
MEAFKPDHFECVSYQSRHNLNGYSSRICDPDIIVLQVGKGAKEKRFLLARSIICARSLVFIDQFDDSKMKTHSPSKVAAVDIMHLPAIAMKLRDGTYLLPCQLNPWTGRSSY